MQSLFQLSTFAPVIAWPVILIGTLLMVATAGFDYERFSITTDVEALISRNLPWHQRQFTFKHSRRTALSP